MMSSEFADVTVLVPTSLVGHEDVSVSATFSYRVADPFAVVVVFSVGEVATQWTFARDLLRDGLTVASGLGDVLVSPAFGGLVQVTVRSPDGAAVLLCDRSVLQGFVDEVFAVVPEESQSGALAVDRFLADLAT